MPDNPIMTDGMKRFRIVIRSAHTNEPSWSEQLDAIRKTGAGYDDSQQAWFIWVDSEPAPIDLINTLYRIASRFGSHIKIEQPEVSSSEQ